MIFSVLARTPKNKKDPEPLALRTSAAVVFLPFVFKSTFDLALVVQRADNSIQSINRYPADKMYSN